MKRCTLVRLMLWVMRNPFHLTLLYLDCCTAVSIQSGQSSMIIVDIIITILL